MAWADLNADENVERHFLAVLEWRRKAGTWTLHAGQVWKQTFAFGIAVGVLQGETDGEEFELDEGSSASLGVGEFYYDTMESTLYVRLTDGLNPNTKFGIYVTYEMYVATSDVAWHRDPLDTSTLQVYFEPLISGSGPEKKQSVPDIVEGTLPDQTTTLELNNAEKVLEKHLHDGSTNETRIRIYSWLTLTTNKIELENLKLVIDGKMGAPDDARPKVKITVYDQIRTFANEFRNTGSPLYTLTDFPDVDPQYLNKPIREVRAVVEGMPAVNVDFDQDAPSTSNNRTWVTQSGQTDVGTIQRTVLASPASTDTRTYVGTNHGIRVGDSVLINKTTDESRTVTAIGSNYIEHVDLDSGAAAGGDTVTRSHVGAVYIVQQNVLYKAQLGVHYTEENALAGGAIGFTFTTDLDGGATPLLPEILAPADQVYVTAYGKKADSITLDGNPFGSNSGNTGNLTNAIVILYDLLKSYVGLSEDELDLDSFEDLAASVDDEIGFAVPFDSFSKYPIFKDILVKLFETSLLVLTLTDDGKWTVSQAGPMGTERFEIGDDELVGGDVDIKYDYKDLASDVVVKYLKREIAEKVSNTQEDAKQVTAQSLNAKFLHRAVKTLEYESLLILEDQAQRLANRLSFIYGERAARYKFTAKNRFMQTNLRDAIKLTKTVLPDPGYDGINNLSRKVAIYDTTMGLRDIELEGDDQKGIEDNSGSWG